MNMSIIFSLYACDLCQWHYISVKKAQAQHRCRRLWRRRRETSNHLYCCRQIENLMNELCVLTYFNWFVIHKVEWSLLLPFFVLNKHIISGFSINNWQLKCQLPLVIFLMSEIESLWWLFSVLCMKKKRNFLLPF